MIWESEQNQSKKDEFLYIIRSGSAMMKTDEIKTAET